MDNGCRKGSDWKRLLAKPTFLSDLLNFDKDNVSAETLSKLGTYIDNPEFTPEVVAKSSTACKGLCLWVRAIHAYCMLTNPNRSSRPMTAPAEPAPQQQLAPVVAAKQEVVQKASKRGPAPAPQQSVPLVAAKQEVVEKVSKRDGGRGDAGELEAAVAALNTLCKKDIGELKALARPPALVKLTMEAVCTLLGLPYEDEQTDGHVDR